MKKLMSLVFAFMTLTAVCFAQPKSYGKCLNEARAYKAEKKYFYAMGSYYDALSLKQSDEAADVYAEYEEVVSIIKSGTLGYKKNQLVTIHDAWMELLSDFEKYWVENCPVTVTVNDLKFKKVDYKKKTYTYTAALDYDYSYKYMELSQVLIDGLNVAYNEDWEVDEEWPLVALNQEKLSDYKVKGAALIRSGNVNYNAFVASVDGQTFFDFSLAVCDRKGNQLYASPSKIIGSGGTFILTGIPEDVAIKIEDGEYRLKAASLNLIYGGPKNIYTDSRSWAVSLPTVSYDVSQVAVETLVNGVGTDDFNAFSMFRKSSGSKTASSSSSGKSKKEEGKVLRFVSGSSDLRGIMNTFYTDILPSGVEYQNVISSFDDYNDFLDINLSLNETLPEDERIDFFVVTEKDLQKYISSDYTLDIEKEVGLTKKDLSNQYEYNKKLATVNGKLKAVSWKNSVHGFAYRRSIARQVLGTDDPEQVQKLLGDWIKFEKVAELMDDSGFKICMNTDYMLRCFNSARKKAWVEGNKIVVDQAITDWIEYSKKFVDKGYVAGDKELSSNVFGCFCSESKLFNIIAGEYDDAEDALGDWAFCQGPAPYSFGNLYICVARGTDNLEAVKELLYTLTCNPEVMKTFVDYGICWPNNRKASLEIASDKTRCYSSLGGQNPYSMINSCGENAKVPPVTSYDLDLMEILNYAMQLYFNNELDLDEAWTVFYANALEWFPELRK